MATVRQKKEQAKKEMEINTENLQQIPEGIALSETEIKLLTELQRKKELVNREVAFIAQQQIVLDYRQEEAEKLYRDNLELEKQLGTSMTSKYGNGTIDIENGIFVPA